MPSPAFSVTSTSCSHESTVVMMLGTLGTPTESAMRVVVIFESSRSRSSAEGRMSS